MNQTFYLALLATIIFIGPNSQALLSNANAYDMEYAGYHCSLGAEFRKINIIHKENNGYNKTCDVIYQKNTETAEVLWNQQRNKIACSTKAGDLAMHLKDRGWACKTAGLALEEIPQGLQH